MYVTSLFAAAGEVRGARCLASVGPWRCASYLTACSAAATPTSAHGRERVVGTPVATRSHSKRARQVLSNLFCTFSAREWLGWVPSREDARQEGLRRHRCVAAQPFPGTLLF